MDPVAAFADELRTMNPADIPAFLAAAEPAMVPKLWRRGGLQHPVVFESFPSGWRFTLDDEELLRMFLQPRANGLPILYAHCVSDVDFYRRLPEDLTAGRVYLRRDRPWYFFSKRVYVRSRIHRTIGDAFFWKASHGRVEVTNAANVVVGYKQPFDLYNGTPSNRGAKTDWRLVEYNLAREEMPDDWILCKIWNVGWEFIEQLV